MKGAFKQLVYIQKMMVNVASAINLKYALLFVYVQSGTTVELCQRHLVPSGTQAMLGSNTVYNEWLDYRVISGTLINYRPWCVHLYTS